MSSDILLDQIIIAARCEEWQTVDKNIPAICNDQKVLGWALRVGLNDSNGHVRDLAASIFEKTADLNEEMKERLLLTMQLDSNPYARFHSAFALAAHDKQYRRRHVRKVLQEAQADPDVAASATQYLTAYNKR